MVETEITFKIDPKKLTEATKQRVGEALLAGGLSIERMAKHLVPVDMGILRASIHTTLKDWDEVHVGSSRVSYAAAVEFGSVPHTPPFAAIDAWATRKGIPEAAWPIWDKIRREGTQPHPFMRPALYQAQDTIARLLKEAMQTAAKETKRL